MAVSDEAAVFIFQRARVVYRGPRRRLVPALSAGEIAAMSEGSVLIC